MWSSIEKDTNGRMFLDLFCGLLTVKMNKVSSSLHLERREVSTFQTVIVIQLRKSFTDL